MCYGQIQKFLNPHQLCLQSENEFVFFLQLLLQKQVLFSPRILNTKHTQTCFYFFFLKSQSELFKPSPPVWICSLLCGCRSAAAERWRCAFCAVVSISSINFTWTSRHFPTTLCCRHPLREAGGREAHAAASRAVKEGREARERKTALTNDPKEPTSPKTRDFQCLVEMRRHWERRWTRHWRWRDQKRITSFNVTFEMRFGLDTLLLTTSQGCRC